MVDFPHTCEYCINCNKLNQAMKLDLTNFNENALKNEPREPYISLWKMKGVLKELRDLREQSMKDETKIAELDAEFMSLVKNLVNLNEIFLTRVPLSQVKDLFNEVSDRIEMFTKETSKETILTLLRFGIYLTSQNSINEKTPNSKVLNDLISNRDDLEIIAAALELTIQIVQKRSIDKNDKACYLVNALNLLRSKEHHFNLFQIAIGINQKGEKIEDLDLIFEIESQATGLNERKQQNAIIMPKQEVVGSELSSYELAKQIAAKYGKEDTMFIGKLEAKITWIRYFNSGGSKRDGLIAILTLLHLGVTLKNEARHLEFIQFLKESVMKEFIQILSQSGDKKLVATTLHSMLRILQKDQGVTVSFDAMIKPPNQRQDEEQPQQSFMLNGLEDISSVKLIEDGLSVVKEVKSKVLNQQVAKYSQVQALYLQMVLQIMGIIKRQHNRTNTLYQDTINQVLPSLLKIIDPSNTVQSNLPYSYKVLHVTAQVLKFCSKPRIEEQFSLVKNMEARITFEIDHLEGEYLQICPDEDKITSLIDLKDRQVFIRLLLIPLSDLVSQDCNFLHQQFQNNKDWACPEKYRKVNFSHISPRLQTCLSQKNTLQLKNLLIDVIFYSLIYIDIVLIGQIIMDSPAITPTLIKNNIIPHLLKALEKRIPFCSDSIEMLIFGLNQISIQEEGQKLVLQSNLFETLLRKVMDNQFATLAMSQQNETIYFRSQLNNLIDRNIEFRNTAQMLINEYVQLLQDFANKQAISYFAEFRTENPDKFKILQQRKTQILQQNQNINFSIQMIYHLANLSNESAVLNRNSREIFTNEVFKRIIELYESFAVIPILQDFQSYFLKILKILVENNHLPQNVIFFLERTGQEMTIFKEHFGPQLFTADHFNFEEKKEDVKDLNDLNMLNFDGYLYRGEKTIVRLGKIMSYIKAFNSLHSATQHQLIQNQQILKIIKFDYYLIRIHKRNQVRVFAALLQEMKTDPKGELASKYLEYFTKPYSSEEDKQLDEAQTQVRLLINQVVDRKQQEMQPQVVNYKVLSEFLTKLAYSSLQIRYAHSKEAFERNQKTIGKLIYKISKEVSRPFLDSIKVDPSNEDLSVQLYQLNLNLIEIDTCINFGYLDGAGFYQFFKKGGINNLIECFHWLADNLNAFDKGYSQGTVFIFDEMCISIKQILNFLVVTKCSEAGIQGLLGLEMGSDFENAKNMFQTFYHIICTKLLCVDQPGDQGLNLLLKVKNKRNQTLIDLIMIIFNYASKGFATCPFLKDGLRNEREQGRRQRNQADPAHVQTLLDMGMGFTRAKIEQALTQTNNNVNNAMILLMEWQTAGDLGLENALQAQIDDGLSSGQSDQEGNVLTLLDNGRGERMAKLKKVQKVSEDQYNEIVRKTQLEGFKWLVETLKNSETINEKYKDQLIQIMLSEKSEAHQKNMYAQFDELFKRDVQLLINMLHKVVLKKEDQDQQMIDTSTYSEQNITTLMKNLRCETSLITKIISNNKQYLKEAVLKSDVFTKAFSILTFVLIIFKDHNENAKNFLSLPTFNTTLQRLMFDLLHLLFVILQLSQLQIAIYASSKNYFESCQKKIKQYQGKINNQQLMDQMLKVIDNYREQVEQSKKPVFNKPIISLCGSIAFKALTAKDLDQNLKKDATSLMFDMVSNTKIAQIFDSKIAQSIAIMYFENNKNLFQQMERIAQKVLWFKYENDQKFIKPDQEQQSHLQTKVNFTSFLKYLQPLSVRDQDVFKKVLRENFDVKTTKKGTILSQDQASITLKEQKFSDIKKHIAKERQQLKTLIKGIDFSGNDKQLKSFSKISKKQLKAQIDEVQDKSMHQMLTAMIENTSLYLDEYQAFLTSQSTQQRLIKPELLLAKKPSDYMQLLETLFKLSLVYPSLSASIIQFKPSIKRTFLNWFIKDFMTAHSLQRIINPFISQEGMKDQYEVTFKPKVQNKASDTAIIKALNNLSGYNHFCNIHEQTIKHEIRTKLMMEALSLLNKTMKDKSMNQTHQRILLINSLTVINALICFDTPIFAKQQLISRENFFNSIRVAIFRDASTKDSNLPPSLIKLLNDLLSDVIDPSLESNSDIVAKSVSILKQLSQFINEQKRREENALEQEKRKKEQEESKEKCQEGDLPMAEQQHISESSDEEAEDMMMMHREEEEDDEEDEEDNEGDENDEDDLEDEEEENVNAWDFNPDEHEDDEDDMIIEEDENEGNNVLLLRDEEEMFEDDYDSQEEGEALFGGPNREARLEGRQFDIINVVPEADREQGVHRWGINRNREPEQRRFPGVSDEEIQVQRILANLNLVQSAEPARPRPYQQNAGWGGAAPADVQLRKSLVDQMYEGLQMVGDKELFEQVSQLRQQLEEELSKEVPSEKNDVQARGVMNMHRIRPRGFEDFDEIMIDYDPLGDRIPHLFRAEGFEDIQLFINNPLDPFIRFPFNPLMPPGLIQENPFNRDAFLGNPMGQRLPHAEPVAENQLFTLYLRGQQQISQTTVENLGQDLLGIMDVQVEEVKEDKKIDSAELQKSFDESQLSNDQLLMNFFQRNIPNVDRELLDERERINERSRSLREQIERQQVDIQIIANQSQNRPQDQQEQEQQISQSPVQSQNIQEQFSSINLQRSPSIQNEPQVENQIVAIEQQPLIQEVIQQQEEQKSQVQEEIKQEEVQQIPQQQPESSNQTFGYDNELLLAYGIDPAILHELPEELRMELLSQIDVRPFRQQNQAQQQQQPVNPAQEERKQPEQQNQPNNAALANELGIDPEFLANLPEDMQLELIQNEQFRQRNLGQQQQQPPQREAEQMDLASFIATVTDPNLRREIFANMDEATIQTLPPNLMAEARNFQSSLRYDRGRARDLIEGMDRRARGLLEELEGRGIGGRPGGFGGYGQGRNEFMQHIFNRGRREEGKANNDQARNMDEIVCARLADLSEEQTYEDVTFSLAGQLSNDERILEALLLILICNDKSECELIPCLQSLVKVQAQNIPIFRNKIINAITFLLKALSINDKESMLQMFPQMQVDSKKTVLILIGTIRMLLRNNKSLMKYILKGLIIREENIQHQKQSQILRKQLKAIKAKATAAMQEVSAFEDVSTPKKSQALILPPLAEIFYLIRSDLFKNDKALMRNLSLLIHQILKEFNIALEELENCKQPISTETVKSIAEVLSLDTINQNLMQALGEFLFQISRKKRENFELISNYCNERSGLLVDLLKEKLSTVVHVFNDIKNRVSPGKMHAIESYSPSQDGQSVQEEEKNDMIIDTSIQPLQEIQKQELKGVLLKLPEEDEKLLKTHLRLQESSETLLRLFKLYNLFYEKFSSEKKSEGEEIDQTDPQAVVAFIHQLYQSEGMTVFMKKVGEVLRIVFRTNLEVTDSISNLIFCVLASYYPELYQSMMNEEVQKKQQEEKKQNTKYQVKMLPLSESIKRQEKFVLFRNASFYNQRIEDLSNFCLVNKRVINKLIKSKNAQVTGEFEGLFKYMPNLLDFENKRNYFKKELAQLKRNQYRDMIQLFIRRDNIFMDAYAQLGVKLPEEMQGKLHIQFTGERGQDAGGLTRDFFIELSREMFNPNYSLFRLSSSGSTYYPNPKSYVERDHLRYFKFIGRVIGKAIFDECLLECYFVKSLYKIMTGEPLLFQDLEDFDNEFYNNLKWCLQNDITPLYATFVAEQDFFGRSEDFELIENGRNVAVTNENKDQYIEKLTYFKLYQCIQKQIDAFLEGFYELIPKDLISIFNHKELELLISGLPNFDINDLKQNTEYVSGYNANSPQVIWLWEILETFENSERAEFLQFVTGSSKVPLDGFKGLMGMRGPQKFTIAKIKSDDILRLPSGHTCFNQIDLPEYPSKEIMHERLLTAIKETKGFGFA